MRKNGVTKICESCQKEFYVPKSLIKRKSFCSWGCRKTKRPISCVKCKKIFLVGTNRKNASYCSNDCRKTSIYIKCKTCKTSVLCEQNLIGRKKYCSKQCWSKGQKGKPAWNRGKKLPEFSGENSPGWKGDNIGYIGIHMWVPKVLGKPHYCTFCERTDLRHRQYHWANISGEYRRDTNDWIRLCVKCHYAFDHVGVFNKTKQLGNCFDCGVQLKDHRSKACVKHRRKSVGRVGS